MKQILNTLYIMTENSYLHLDHETLKVENDGQTKMQVPIHHLGAVVCFGNVLLSPAAMARCVEDGRAVVLLDHNGHFKGRVEGPTSGNVLLRLAQHKAFLDHEVVVSIARNIAAGKLQNTRSVILRGAREADNQEDEDALRKTAGKLANCLQRLSVCKDLDSIRGIEGEAGRAYFESFDRMIKTDRQTFRFERRSRRPPLDSINALISFLYALVLNDCQAGVESVGLDPQIGFLHAVRPGRPALALDLMEELRSILADRIALTLINRRQITANHFEPRPGGAVYLNENGRKEVVIAYQKRKQEEVMHSVIEQKVPLGLVSHTQARILARFLRQDIEEYLPFIYH
jgi:CRISPR-associated protein Cas1